MPLPSTRHRLVILAAAAAASLLVPSDSFARARGAKRSAVSEIIVHATGGPFCKGGAVAFSPPGTGPTIKKFFEGSGQVSIHYIVDRNGDVLKSVPEDEVAIHAINHNDQSIGIELINAGDGHDPYPDVQVKALAELVKSIQQRWNIPLAEVKGHEQVDRSTFPCGGREARRKQDPGPLFPWEKVKAELRIAEKGAAQRRK